MAAVTALSRPRQAGASGWGSPINKPGGVEVFAYTVAMDSRLEDRSMAGTPHYTLRRWFSYLAVALLAGLGLLGVAVSLFPPNAERPGPMEALLGLGFSGLFFFSAWVIWRWAHSCLLCREASFTDGAGCEMPAPDRARRR